MKRLTPHGRRMLAAACGLALALASAQAADARLGEPDPSFGTGGIATPALGLPATFRAVAVQPDGAIVAGGSITDSQPAMLVARLTPAGVLDTSFAEDGTVTPEGSIEDGAIAAVAIAPNGDILAAGGGAAGNIETNPSSVLARITPSGVSTDVPLPIENLTSTFIHFVSSIALMPSGHIVLGGWAFDNTVDREVFMTMRLLPTGAADTGFSGDGVAFADFGPNVNARAFGVGVDGLGRVTLTGDAANSPAAARFTSGGAPDPAFAGTGQIRAPYVNTPYGGAGQFFGVAQRGDTVLAVGTVAREQVAVVQALTDGAGESNFGGPELPGAALWAGGSQVTTAESVATTSVGGAATAGRSISGSVASLQTGWFTPAGAQDAAGGGIVTRAQQLQAGSPPVALALTPGDGTVVAGTGPNNSPFVARYLPNAAPIAALSAAATATAGAPVTLDAGGSSDPEGEPLQYAFDLDGNGSFEFDGGANPFAATSFAAPGTYTLGVRVTDPRGASATAARSVAVSAAQTPPPQPLLSQQGVARPISGVIRIRLPGTKKFVRITELTAIPNGTEIDARKGRVLITVLHDATGRLDAAKFYAGRFIFTQGKGAVPLTTLKLSGGSFAGCGRKAKARRSLLAVASSAQNGGKKKPVRKLWGDGRGKFRTRGKWGAATVRGTKWLTQDRCDGTRIKVVRGKVDAKDLVRPKRRAKRLNAGDAILIRKAG